MKIAFTSSTLIFRVAVVFILLAVPVQLRAQQPASPAPMVGQYKALVIGINDYNTSKGLKKLQSAVADAKAVGQILQDKYGFDVSYLLDASATRKGILDKMDSLRRAIDENGSLLIYYAGHGTQDGDSGATYWIPSDSDGTDFGDMIIASQITSNIKAARARHVLLISDSCYSGGINDAGDRGGPTNTSTAPSYLQKMATFKSRHIMASGGNSPVADADGQDGHSVFASALLRVLNDNANQIFSATSMFSADNDGIKSLVSGKESNQIPRDEVLQGSDHDGGDCIFLGAQVPPPDLAKFTGVPLPASASAGATPSAAPATAAVATTAPAAVDAGNASAKAAYDKGAALHDAGHFVDAFPLLMQACYGGIPGGCNYVGYMYDEGTGTTKSQAQAVNFFRKGCDAGNGDSCRFLGYRYLYGGDGIAVNYKESVADYEKACNLGDALGCACLGSYHDTGRGGTPVDYALALRLMNKGCDGGAAYGCTRIGDMYLDGHGVAVDPKQALVAYRKGCLGNYAYACTSVGSLLAQQKDFAQAVTFYGKGCTGGDQSGCVSQAAMLESGQGVTKDLATAASLYRAACKSGDADGCKAAQRLGK